MNRILRRGDTGIDVEELQEGLSQLGYSVGRVDGDFGPRTADGLRRLQIATSITGRELTEGECGQSTWDTLKACLKGQASQRPEKLRALSDAERRELFGSFDWTPRPAEHSRGQEIRILGRWAGENITAVEISQLCGVSVCGLDRKCTGRVSFHTAVAAQLQAAFRAIERAGLVGQILTYDGAWVPRYVRGSFHSLSNHAYGTAIDLNAAWNGLGKAPAPRGAKGSVLDLVPHFERFGFFWGGRFSRRDGMHFEAARVLNPEQISELERQS